MHTKQYLEDKDLERYYSNAQFIEGKVVVSNFDQNEPESLSVTWERFKLILRKCLNHNISVMEHMTHFISGLKTPIRILFDTSARGTLIAKTYDEVNMLIENMCHNEYHLNDRVVKRGCSCSWFEYNIIISYEGAF